MGSRNKDHERISLADADAAATNGATHSSHASANGGMTKAQAEVRRQITVSILVCLFYISVSSSMVFVNKALTYEYHFNYINVLLFLQMAFTILFLRASRTLFGIDVPEIEVGTLKKVAPVSLFYCLNALAALAALQKLSVPSYTMVKRLSPLFTITLEYVLLRKKSSGFVLAALGIMATGTVLAAKADTSSSTLAWSLGFCSCIFQASYLTFVKRSGIDTGLSAVGIVYYHAFLSLPFFGSVIFLKGEFSDALLFENWSSPSFLVLLCFSLGMGLLLNYALFLCTEKTSPTSTVVSGQVKAMGQTAIGIFTFGGVDLNMKYVLGTLINIAGGVMYAYAKYKALRSTT